MLPRLRALVITLLVLAYGLAAIGVATFTPTSAGAGVLVVEGQQNPESLTDGFLGNVADLAYELGDTSDDMAEVPMPVTVLRLASVEPERFHAVHDSRPLKDRKDSLLRPPNGAASRAA
jgi:hypothetical protein